MNHILEDWVLPLGQNRKPTPCKKTLPRKMYNPHNKDIKMYWHKYTNSAKRPEFYLLIIKLWASKNIPNVVCQEYKIQNPFFSWNFVGPFVHAVNILTTQSKLLKYNEVRCSVYCANNFRIHDTFSSHFKSTNLLASGTYNFMLPNPLPCDSIR
jgi:hypothetical protein